MMFFGGRNNFIALAKLILLKGEAAQSNFKPNDEVEAISSYLDPAQTL